jgi:hypothetical protein
MFAVSIFTRSGYGAKSVGHHGWLVRLLMHKAYVPVEADPATGDIWRDPETGFAKRKSYAQGGEIIVRMRDRAAWPGYWRSPAATNKKIITDVFKKGDMYYR